MDGFSTTVDHAVKCKKAFDRKVLKRAPKEVVFKEGVLVQVFRSDLLHTVSTMKKLVPMWSIPRRISMRKLNSYTLETLDGAPLNGLFHAHRLRIFRPREGTKLALAEVAQKETVEDDGESEEGDRVAGGVEEVDVEVDKD